VDERRQQVGGLWRKRTEAADDAVSDPRVETLRRLPMFAPLPTATLVLLAFRLKEIVVPAGETLFVRGESGGHFYVIVEGELEVLLESGETKVVRDYVGEIGAPPAPAAHRDRARADGRAPVGAAPRGLPGRHGVTLTRARRR
jgi:Cyclic nucleotide-binding domain